MIFQITEQIYVCDRVLVPESACKFFREDFVLYSTQYKLQEFEAMPVTPRGKPPKRMERGEAR
jgi:hypothetical protein